jgi:hypothetical protein
LDLEKRNFLIGSRFSYFNSREPLMIIPKIDKKAKKERL